LDLVGQSLAELFAVKTPAEQPVVSTAKPTSAAAPLQEAPKVRKTGLMLYVGVDQPTYNAFELNFRDTYTFYGSGDLSEIKRLLQSGDVAILVFDSTAFIRPGMAITRWVKENTPAVRVVHITSESRITEEYEKYRQYQLHLQPDFRGEANDIYTIIKQIRDAR
jgi:hypothetical protein